MNSGVIQRKKEKRENIQEELEESGSAQAYYRLYSVYLGSNGRILMNIK